MTLRACQAVLFVGLSLVTVAPLARSQPLDETATIQVEGKITRNAPMVATGDPARRVDFVRASGRFGYTLPDGRFVPAPGVEVRSYRSTNGFGTYCTTSRPAGWNEPSTYTDEDGYFDWTFPVDPCLTCTARDIFLTFRMNGYFTAIQKNFGLVCGDKPRYFETAIVNGVEPDEHIDFGTQAPAGLEGNAMVHAFSTQMRLMQWLDDIGPDPGGIIGWWDSPPAASHILSPAEIGCDPATCDSRIEVGTDDWFDDYAIAELTARAWLTNNVTPPTLLYCNGVCDDTGCSYCLWCTEEEGTAYWQGAAAWMAVSALKRVPSSRIWRNTDIDGLTGCAVGPQNPLGTPGLFAAALRDIADGDHDDHPEYPGVRDRAHWADVSVMDVIQFDQPGTPLEFFEDYRNRWIIDCADLWETAANCGYDIDVIGPGVVQGGVTSTSHVANVLSTNVFVDVEWGTPNDDCSGIAGYSVSATQNVPVLPDAIADVGAVNAWRTGVLASGTWWINVRAVDASGRWSNVYASFGPVLIANSTPANLTHVTRAGWSDPVVPRAAADANSTNAPAPTTLPGNAKATWWNSSIANVGFQSTGTGSGTWVIADGSGFYNPFDPVDHADAVPVLSALQNHQSLNLGPIQVKGGRHTFGAISDFVGEIAEDSELDNGWAKSWVWTPLQVALGGSVFRLAPPDRIGGWEYDPVSGYFNCDGLRFTQSPDVDTETGYWNALTLVPADEEVDYDARMHIASTGAGDGFRANSGYSARPAGCLDAVFVNYNQTQAVNWDVGIVQTTDPPKLSSYESRHVRSTYLNWNTQTLVNMPANQPMLLLEFYVATSDLGYVGLQARTTNGESPVHLMWLDAGFVTGDMDDNSASTTTDAAGVGRLDVDIATEGYHCLVVYRDPKDGLLDQSIDLLIGVGPTPPDLVPALVAGWDAALVPRPAPDAAVGAVAQPTSLTGDFQATWLNLASANASPAALGGAVTHHISVDGQPLYEIPVGSGYSAGGTDRSVNYGPTGVRGGLHTLHASLDGPEAVAEISETNNFVAGQWAWSGPALGFGPTLALPQPADPQGGHAWLVATETWYNADGFRTPTFDPGGVHGMWGGVAAMPGASSDLTLRLHAPSDDPLVAFRTPLATSTQSGRELDFVLLDFATQGGGAWDVGVSSVTGSSEYQLDVVASVFLDPSGGSSPNALLAANELLDVYEVPLAAGVWWMRVRNLSGGTDLGVAVFAPGEGAQGRADHILPSSAFLGGPGDDDTILVEVGAGGTHGLAVFKMNGQDAASPATYRIEFANPTSAPDRIGPTATRIARIQPNPFNPRTTVHYELERAGRVELRLFNLRGEAVRSLVLGDRDAGFHEATWDGTDDAGRPVSSGVYLALLRTNGVAVTEKMVLLK